MLFFFVYLFTGPQGVWYGEDLNVYHSTGPATAAVHGGIPAQARHAGLLKIAGPEHHYYYPPPCTH